jgi:hypothetical protein
MARDLETAIERVLRGDSTYTSGCRYYYSPREEISGSKKYLEIPINEDVFEVPVFALNTFVNLTADNRDLSTNVLTAMLYTLNKEPRYKSLDRYMRDIILEQFASSRLVECEVKQGTENILYYATHGAVFDRYFKPMMMCSWLIEKVGLNDTTRKYRFIKPILRINPDCYISQADPMQRWIAKKAAVVGLYVPLYKPFNYDLTTAFENDSASDILDLTVEICKCPFKIKTADTPSISTTNKDLLQIAIDHIEEIVS